MIFVICGLIGAGKSTYAKKSFDYYTDFDELGSKSIQLEKTWELHKNGESVAHITCYPTPEERAYFDTIPSDQIKYIWINTPESQCKENIIKRGRPCNLVHLDETLSSNQRLAKLAAKSSLPFEFVNVFPTDERW